MRNYWKGTKRFEEGTVRKVQRNPQNVIAGEKAERLDWKVEAAGGAKCNFRF